MASYRVGAHKLPPPVWGRVGEGGNVKPRCPIHTPTQPSPMKGEGLSVLMQVGGSQTPSPMWGRAGVGGGKVTSVAAPKSTRIRVLCQERGIYRWFNCCKNTTKWPQLLGKPLK